jgi:2'-5' RNA ligase
METLRTFIAIDVKVEPTLKKKWVELKTLLYNDSIKWVNEQTIHLTLSFLGDTPIGQIENIAHQLELNLKKTSTFRITLNGFGFFGKSSSPKVIWVGISESQNIAQLRKIVNSTLSTLGFDDSQGKFSPHITLGRVKQIKSSIELVNYINRNKSEILQDAKIDSVFFYQSILKPTGSIYKPLREIKLLSL